MPSVSLRAALLTVLSMATGGCSSPASAGDSGTSTAEGSKGPLGVACSSDHPSYANEVAPIFATCGGGDGCHGHPTRDSLIGTSMGELECPLDMGDVFPGSLEKSYLMNKLTGVGMCPLTNTMPPGERLSAFDIQTIADWICEGAPDN